MAIDELKEYIFMTQKITVRSLYHKFANENVPHNAVVRGRHFCYFWGRYFPLGWDTSLRESLPGEKIMIKLN